MEVHGLLGLSPEEGHKDDQKDGALLVWGKTELGLLSLEKRKFQGDLIAPSFTYKALQETWRGTFNKCGDVTRANGF